MPRLTGVFEQFPQLDIVLPQNLLQWLSVKQDVHFLANVLGNRILYPQTIALNKQELEIDFAILREAIKQKPMLFYEPQTNKILIPEQFVQRFPPLAKLAGAVIEAINPKGVIQILIKRKKLEKVGSLISPDINRIKSESGKVRIIVEGKPSLLNLNTLYISQTSSSEVKIEIGEAEYKVSGGKLGVIIDLRLNKS